MRSSTFLAKARSVKAAWIAPCRPQVRELVKLTKLVSPSGPVARETKAYTSPSSGSRLRRLLIPISVKEIKYSGQHQWHHAGMIGFHLVVFEMKVLLKHPVAHQAAALD